MSVGATFLKVEGNFCPFGEIRPLLFLVVEPDAQSLGVEFEVGRQ